VEIKRAYKFRFYPTVEQKELLAKTFGCARFVYNHMLKTRTDAYYHEQKKIGYHETSALLTVLKKQDAYDWLNTVSSVPVQQALRHLQTAFGHFFAKRNKYPNFKSKFDKQSAEYTASAFKFDNSVLTLAKMKEPLAITWSRTLPRSAKLTTVTVSKDCAGRYFVSLLCDEAASAKTAVESRVGIDKWYPSSKRCNACGYTLSALSLNTRSWLCPDCGSTHDRDVNAAKNILTAGLAGLAFGENVSPVCI
jgi:putative transposase